MWVIGDLQGCASCLRSLLAQIPSADPLLFLGDVVNRGPESLDALRAVRDIGERAITLLGNHDLHLLASGAGIRPLHDDDTLQDILDAPDREQLLNWLRARPLAHATRDALFVHAGVPPSWTVAQTLALANEVEARLRAPDYRDFLATMYGTQPARWDDSLVGADRLRCVINALTRMRFVAADGTMDFKTKSGVASTPKGLTPWFDHPQRATHPRAGGLPVVFGHWSALGLMIRADAVCLDTGCVWGGQLTAMRWPDRTLVQVQCRKTAAS